MTQNLIVNSQDVIHKLKDFLELVNLQLPDVLTVKTVNLPEGLTAKLYPALFFFKFYQILN